MAAHSSLVPHHIAIVMDGNGRWATKRLLPRIAGHKQGVDALTRCVRACLERGIGVLTVFAFSSENWNRPPEEVSGLMELLAVAVAVHYRVVVVVLAVCVARLLLLVVVVH